MNKMFTTAMAIAAVAGLASATIETPPAGYVDVEGTAGGIFVGTPFLGFDGAVATLGDIDGSALDPSTDLVKILSSSGKVLFSASYVSAANTNSTKSVIGWYNGNGCSNAFPLVRGTAIQFVSDGRTITIAGRLESGAVNVNLVRGHNFIANASPVDKTLGDFIVTGANYKYTSDYIAIGSTKYVYLDAAKAGRIQKDAGWYLRDVIIGSNPGSAVSQNSVTIPAGTGIRGYFTKADGTDAAVLTTPGL